MTISKLTRRRFLHGASALAAVATTGLPRLAAAADETVLRTSLNSDINRIDPADWSSQGERDVVDTIYAKLINYKPGDKWEWELEAAESIEQVDPTHIKFKLKPGILWTNGYGETTAEDVKYSFERIADPAMKSGYKDDWAALDRVEVTDTYSGIIVLKEPFAPLWNSTLPGLSGSIVCKKALEKNGGHITTDPFATSGPYAIKEWVPKQKLVLERNPGWQITRPYFSQILMRPIEDDKTAEIAFMGDELDYTKISPTSVKSFKDNPPPHSKLIERPTLDYIWLGLNVEHPKLKDPKVREAIQNAVDVGEILDGAYSGAAQYATGVVGPGLAGHLDTPMPKRDLDKARKLLAESEQPGGFKATLCTLSRSDRTLAAQIIQSNLADIGIEIEIKILESGQFWSLMDNVGKDVEMYISGFGGAPDPSWGTMWFTPDQVGIWNWERWNSPEFGELHKKALAESDPAVRAKMYQKMGELMNESHAYIWLANEPWVAVYRDNIAPASLPNGWVRYALFKNA
jgi:peptide/nickel transport system substrate-binding protein